MLPPTEKHKIKSGYMESYMDMCLPKADNKKKLCSPFTVVISYFSRVSY